MKALYTVRVEPTVDMMVSANLISAGYHKRVINAVIFVIMFIVAGIIFMPAGNIGLTAFYVLFWVILGYSCVIGPFTMKRRIRSASERMIALRQVPACINIAFFDERMTLRSDNSYEIFYYTYLEKIIVRGDMYVIHFTPSTYVVIPRTGISQELDRYIEDLKSRYNL